MFHLHLRNHRKLSNYLPHTLRNSTVLLWRQEAFHRPHMETCCQQTLSVDTCFTPLSNSTDFMSNSKYRSTRYMRTLQRIHVMGSGMPTTEMAGRPPEPPGGPPAPGCELNGLCLCPASATPRRPSLRPCAAGCPLEGRAHTPAHRRPQALVQRQSPAERPSSRHAARLVMRCITAGRTQRYGRRLNHGPGLGQPPLSRTPLQNLMQLTPCCTHNPCRFHDVHTHDCCLQVLLEMQEKSDGALYLALYI